MRAAGGQAAAIRFELKPIGFQLEHGEVSARHVPATMAGGVAVFDYNHDGRPDIFFTNGANLATLKKDDPKYRNRLFRNDGKGVFTDVTDSAGLAGTGFDTGAAVGDYDNDGYPDLFVAGVHHNTLYHNNGDGTFTDVTEKAGISNLPDPKYGPMWGITAVWMDVNNDGLLDLFVVNYLQWDYATEPLCDYKGAADYCSPRSYQGLPNQLYLNKGNGKFEDVSEQWGIRAHVGKGMGGGMADYDLDGRPDLFVTNDGSYNFLFHNLGNKFEEVAFQKNVALTGRRQFHIRNGAGFSRYQQRRIPGPGDRGAGKPDLSDMEEHSRERLPRSDYAERHAHAVHAHGRIWRGVRRFRQRRMEGSFHQPRRRVVPRDAEYHGRATQHGVPEYGSDGRRQRALGSAHGRGGIGRLAAGAAPRAGVRRSGWRWQNRCSEPPRSHTPPKSG